MFAETNNLLDDLYPDYIIPGTDTASDVALVGGKVKVLRQYVVSNDS
jgi:hypothetical protein